MNAPALVLLADGSTDARIVASLHAYRVAMQKSRPGMMVHIAFLDHCPPSGPQVIATLARRGVSEVVFVPVNLSALQAGAAAETLLQRVQAAHPAMSFEMARPIGPEAALLGDVDRNLRAALSQTHATELDGLVLATEGAADSRSCALLSRRARQWSQHHRLPAIVAGAQGPLPSVASAVRTLRAQGRRHIAVGSLLVTAGEAWQQARREALGAGAMAIGAPLGSTETMLDITWGRYAVGAMALIDFGFDAVGDQAGAEPAALEVVTA